MSPATRHDPSLALSNNKIFDQYSRKVNKSKKPSKITPKRKNGLLRTEISDRSELIQIAKRNSIESPLLRLPPELRNMIWDYVLGHQQISITNSLWDPSCRVYRLRSMVSIPMLFETGNQGWVMTRPAFSLPRVCRQIYVEASTMMYTLNRFDFRGTYTIDHLIRKHVPGQRCLIACVTVPISYFQVYLQNRRKPFRVTFPNIKCVIVEYNTARLHSAVSRVSDDWASIPGRQFDFQDNRLKIWIENRVKQGEGGDMELE